MPIFPVSLPSAVLATDHAAEGEKPEETEAGPDDAAVPAGLEAVGAEHVDTDGRRHVEVDVLQVQED